MLKDVIVKKSKRHQLGLFSRRGFRKGEFVLDIIPGRIVHRKNVKHITPKSERWDYYDKDHYYFMGDPEYYINHSCEPNVYVFNRKIFALRDIKSGEELVFDYAINGIDHWKIRCLCGSRSCRGIVSGYFFDLPMKTQRSYLPYLDGWFRKAFRGELSRINPRGY